MRVSGIRLAARNAVAAVLAAIGCFTPLAANPLPKPEFWQPSIDPDLPPFDGCTTSLSHQPLEGSAPAILPDLVARWTGEYARLCGREVRVPPPFGPPLANRSPQLRNFIEGKSDFAFLTREISQADLDSYRRIHPRDPLSIPIAGGSYRHFGYVDTLVVIVNRSNPVERLTFAQIASIFFRSSGSAPRYWRDLGGRTGPHRMHIIGSEAWKTGQSARASFLRRRLVESGATDGTWRTGLPASGIEADVPARVAADPDAIGFTGLGHVLPADKPLAIAPDRSAAAIAPSYTNVALGLYPFARTVDLLVSTPDDGKLDPRLCSFARFLLSKPGQTIVRDQEIFLPLRHAQLLRSRAVLDPYC